MRKYAKIVNEATKQCSVGIGTNTQFYKSIGMTEMDVEQACNGQWYVAGYAPIPGEKSKEEILAEKRALRNQYLQDSDKYMLSDFPISSTERNKWKEYRVYLRDFFNDEIIFLKVENLLFEYGIISNECEVNIQYIKENIEYIEKRYEINLTK